MTMSRMIYLHPLRGKVASRVMRGRKFDSCGSGFCPLVLSLSEPLFSHLKNVDYKSPHFVHWMGEGKQTEHIWSSPEQGTLGGGREGRSGGISHSLPSCLPPCILFPLSLCLLRLTSPDFTPCPVKRCLG